MLGRGDERNHFTNFWFHFDKFEKFDKFDKFEKLKKVSD